MVRRRDGWVRRVDILVFYATSLHRGRWSGRDTGRLRPVKQRGGGGGGGGRGGE